MNPRDYNFFAAGILAFLIFFSGDVFGFAETPGEKNNSGNILKDIYKEIKDMGKCPGDDVLKREFWTGNDDDDDTNKDIHVLIMIQNMEDKEKMTIQVTRFERDKVTPTVSHAKEERNIICLVSREKIDILKSDIPKKERESFFSELLSAIRKKKKLLKLLRKQIPLW